MDYFLEVPTGSHETTSINCAWITGIQYNLGWSKPRIIISYHSGENLTVCLHKDCDAEEIKRRLEKKSNEVTDKLIKHGNFFKR